MNMNLKNILKQEEYQDLPKENLLFLCFGGSISYGTNSEQSDVDIRGIYMPPLKDLLLMKDTSNYFFKSEVTDTILYSLKKFFDLAKVCNPNIIEMLGCLDEHYENISEAGKLLLDNKHLFLSKKAYSSFSGYARSQLYRMKNALSTTTMSLCEKQFVVKDSLENLYDHLEKEFPTFKRDMLIFKILDENGKELKKHGNQLFLEDVLVEVDDLSKIGETYIYNKTTNSKEIKEYINLNKTKLRFDLNMKNINEKEFKSIYTEIASFANGYEGNIGRRNRKKDAYHLNKHAMHLVRLFLMGIEILQSHKINTFRTDYEELLAIKHGKYQNNDGSYQQEFFDYIDELAEKLNYAYKKSTLSDEPDYDKLNELYLNIVKTAYKNQMQFDL